MRKSIVAGQFYPSDFNELNNQITEAFVSLNKYLNKAGRKLSVIEKLQGKLIPYDQITADIVLLRLLTIREFYKFFFCQAKYE